jgi:hypothetical protein
MFNGKQSFVQQYAGLVLNIVVEDPKQVVALDEFDAISTPGYPVVNSRHFMGNFSQAT